MNSNLHVFHEFLIEAVSLTSFFSILGVYRCELCGKTYASYHSLNHHMKVHSGQTRCTLCGGIFSKVAGLRNHLTKVHKLSKLEIRSLVPTQFRCSHLWQ